jgi:hypothetical protein
MQSSATVCILACMESRQPDGDEQEARRRLLRLAAETRPHGQHLTPAQLQDWARRVLDRSGLKYSDVHVEKLLPLLGTLASRSPRMGRAARRAQLRAGRWRGR